MRAPIALLALFAALVILATSTTVFESSDEYRERQIVHRIIEERKKIEAQRRRLLEALEEPVHAPVQWT